MLKGFKQFILRGNVVDLAVGVVVGASFGAVVTSMVNNILTPVIGAVFKSPDFSNLFFTINSSKFMYGKFINDLVSFIIVTGSIYFFVVTPINTLIAKSKKGKPLDPTTKKCPKCVSEINIEASKCPFCTTDIL